MDEFYSFEPATRRVVGKKRELFGNKLIRLFSSLILFGYIGHVAKFRLCTAYKRNSVFDLMKLVIFQEFPYFSGC